MHSEREERVRICWEVVSNKATLKSAADNMQQRMGLGENNVHMALADAD